MLWDIARKTGSKFFYEYDMGDCGGIGGYEDLLAALRDPKHEQHDEMVGRVGEDFDPAAFDLAAANKAFGKRGK